MNIKIIAFRLIVILLLIGLASVVPTPLSIPTPVATATVQTETVPLNPPKPVYLDKYAMAPKTPTIHTGEALNWINIQTTPRTTYILVSEDGLWEEFVGRLKNVLHQARMRR